MPFRLCLNYFDFCRFQTQLGNIPKSLKNKASFIITYPTSCGRPGSGSCGAQRSCASWPRCRPRPCSHRRNRPSPCSPPARGRSVPTWAAAQWVGPPAAAAGRASPAIAKRRNGGLLRGYFWLSDRFLASRESDEGGRKTGRFVLLRALNLWQAARRIHSQDSRQKLLTP